METETIKLIEKHLKKARKKHPCFASSLLHFSSIATEELGEMVKNINDAYITANIKKSNNLINMAKDEALDLIAVLIRFIEND